MNLRQRSSLLNRITCSSLARLNRDEWGAAYSISVLLILPIYIAFMTFTIEMVLLLNSFQSLSAAMQTAGHTTRAWVSHRDSLTADGGSLHEVVHSAVGRTMAPFVTTHHEELQSTDEEFSKTLQQSGLSSHASQRYAKKIGAVQNALRVQIKPNYKLSDGLLVTVQYDSPLWIPFFEPLFATGHRGSIAYRTLEKEIWVPLTAAEINRQSLGIPYSPKQVRDWPK